MAAVAARSLLAASLLGVALGHGRLTQPVARNLNDNGAVGGGPGSVHSFEAGHTKYQHGICGNPAGSPQAYNRVGEVKASYIAGGTAEFKVVITAHHIGFFEFELCTDAGLLSESCFMMHRLLKEGCHCSCEGDPSHSCTACDECRRWWKPLLEGEMGQFAAQGYEGPALKGQGNLVPFEFTMRYKIPAGIKSSRAVLRWHYMTTNSCTSKSSAPEEFWNCADVSISDEGGDMGGEVAFDNAHLESLVVPNLIPALREGSLTGVYATCPADVSGNLMGVGSAQDYASLCGAAAGDSFVNCRNLASGGGGGGSADEAGPVDCTNPPDSGIVCEHECSGTWFQCAGGVAYTKSVPVGTLCKDSSFVLAATCSSAGGSTLAPDTEPEPQPESEPATSTVMPQPGTPKPTTAPATPTEAPSTSTVPASTTAPAVTTVPSASAQEACAHAGCSAGCLAVNGVCYGDASLSYCSNWPENIWCGSSLAQVRKHRFLGHALVQEGLVLQRISEEL